MAKKEKEKEEILETEVKEEKINETEVKEQPAKKLFSSKEKGTRLS